MFCYLLDIYRKEIEKEIDKEIDKYIGMSDDKLLYFFEKSEKFFVDVVNIIIDKFNKNIINIIENKYVNILTILPKTNQFKKNINNLDKNLIAYIFNIIVEQKKGIDHDVYKCFVDYYNSK
jgi:hypothetical protein